MRKWVFSKLPASLVSRLSATPLLGEVLSPEDMYVSSFPDLALLIPIISV
jgi:aryl-alcohol dehydrogenase-like predicted oxidoreductase